MRNEDETEDGEDNGGGKQLSVPPRPAVPTSYPPVPKKIAGWTVVRHQQPVWFQAKDGDGDGFYSFYWYLQNTTGERRNLPPPPDVDNDDDSDSSKEVQKKKPPKKITEWAARPPTTNSISKELQGIIVSVDVDDSVDKSNVEKKKTISESIVSVKNMKFAAMKEVCLGLNLFVPRDTMAIMGKKVLEYNLKLCDGDINVFLAAD